MGVMVGISQIRWQNEDKISIGWYYAKRNGYLA